MKKYFLLAGILFGAFALGGCSTYTVQPVHADVEAVVVEPDLVFIPGYNIYVVAEPGIRVFFFGGYYYRHYGGFWHRARHYEGPWEDWRQGVPFREPSDDVIREERGRGHFVKPSQVHRDENNNRRQDNNREIRQDNKREIKQDTKQQKEQQKEQQKQNKERQKQDNRDQDKREN